MAELTNIILSFFTLTILEIVLGIDNLVFLAIIIQKLPKSQQKQARQVGLTLAWVMRLLLLAFAIWLTKLTHPLVTLFGLSFSVRDLFLIAGGLFLLAKATQEIHAELEISVAEQREQAKGKFISVITQVVLLDLVFSLDSILTAIGLTQIFWLMAAAITIAILAMIFASEPLSRLIEKHPTIKMLALSFLILIGMVLVADGLSFHIPRGYIYFAMGFSLLVEALNIARRKRRERIKTGKGL